MKGSCITDGLGKLFPMGISITDLDKAEVNKPSAKDIAKTAAQLAAIKRQEDIKAAASIVAANRPTASAFLPDGGGMPSWLLPVGIGVGVLALVMIMRSQ